MNPDDSTAPERDDDAFERALLRAGQRERAPEGAERRLLSTLGVAGSTGVLASLLSRYSARLGPRGWIISVAIGVTAIGATQWVRTRLENTPALETVETVAPEAPRAVPENPAAKTGAPLNGAAESAPPATPSTRVEDLPSTTPAPEKASPQHIEPAAPATVVRATEAAKADPAPSLAREVELVSKARTAIARGDASAALHALDDHDREFAAGALMPESRALRIEALVLAGGDSNTARAKTLGDAFLAEHPTGPQARRVRSVLHLDP